ncbi:uncharacterized protein LOC116348620 [Contarinia nasturtii]|nr:uncharacterized protein LOC116348620 [Contarinia nasturtii]
MINEEETYQSSDEEIPIPKSLKISFAAVVHAELNSESIRRSPQASHADADQETKKMMVENKEDVDEIFAIVNDVKWRIVAQDVDHYRIKERKSSTPHISDTESACGKGQPSSPLNSPSRSWEKTIHDSPVEAPLPQRPIYIFANKRQLQLDKEEREPKRPTYSREKMTRQSQKRPPNTQSYADNSSERKRFKRAQSYDSDEENNQEEEKMEDSSKQFPNERIKNERSPLAPSNTLDDFDSILSSGRYEKGQLISGGNSTQELSSYSNLIFLTSSEDENSS